MRVSKRKKGTNYLLTTEEKKLVDLLANIIVSSTLKMEAAKTLKTWKNVKNDT